MYRIELVRGNDGWILVFIKSRSGSIMFNKYYSNYSYVGHYLKDLVERIRL